MFSQDVSIRKWLVSVQEADYVLEKIETKTSTTPRDKSESVLKVKLAALEMRAHLKDKDIEEILADIPRGEQNRHPTDKQYSIQCTSFGMGNCTNTLCVANKSFDLCPVNSDKTINHMSVHWSNHLKGLYDTKKYHTWY